MGILDRLFGKKSRDSGVRDVAIEKEEVKMKSRQMEGREEAKTQEIRKVREVDLSTLGDMTRARDVRRLSETFQQAANWDTKGCLESFWSNLCLHHKNETLGQRHLPQLAKGKLKPKQIE